MRMLLGLALLAIAAGPSAAAGLDVDRVRGYLIYEDTGNLSKDVVGRQDQVVANDENGTSTQLLVDVVVAGPADTLAEGAMLLVWVRRPFDEPGTPAMVDTGWPLNYIGHTGQVVRSLVIDHDCNPVELHARVDDGQGNQGNEFIKTFNLTCGD